MICPTENQIKNGDLIERYKIMTKHVIITVVIHKRCVLKGMHVQWLPNVPPPPKY